MMTAIFSGYFSLGLAQRNISGLDGGTHKESLFFKYCCLVIWNSVSSQNPGILSHRTRFPGSSLKITTLSYLGSLQYLIREIER